MSNRPSYVAGGDIKVSRFVKIEASVDHTVVVCGAGDIAIGVSHEGPELASLPPDTTASVDLIAAYDGNSCRVYGIGDSCEVFAGGTITAGALLKPDASAKAVVCSSGDEYSAVARAGAAADERCQITLEHGVAP